MSEQAQEAEQAVIGGLMVNGSALSLITLQEHEFLFEEHQRIFRAICKVSNRGEPVDMVTVAHELRDQYPNTEYVGYLSEMARNTPSAANIETYAEMVQRYHRRRNACFIANTLLQNIEKHDQEAIDDAVRGLMDISAMGKSFEHNTEEMMRAAYDYMERAATGDGVGLKTGLEQLDEALGGLHPGLTVVAARPGMGKTTFGLNLAMYIKEHVGFFSSEQPYDQIGMRMIARDAGISLHDMRTGRLNEEKWMKVASVIEELIDADHMHIYDKPGMSINDIIRQARKWKHTHDIHMILVDYIQNIYGFDRKADLRVQVLQVAKTLADLGKELGVPVVALAQVNRKCEERENKRPHISDIKESGAVEEAADELILLYREEYYDPHTIDKKGILEGYVGKNRHGPTGAMEFAWIKEQMKVANLENRYG